MHQIAKTTVSIKKPKNENLTSGELNFYVKNKITN